MQEGCFLAFSVLISLCLLSLISFSEILMGCLIMELFDVADSQMLSRVKFRTPRVRSDSFF